MNSQQNQWKLKDNEMIALKFFRIKITAIQIPSQQKYPSRM